MSAEAHADNVVRLDADATGTSIVKTYDPALGYLHLSGTDTVENYETVLRTISYDNTATERVGYDRTIQFEASDGQNYVAQPLAFVLFLGPDDLKIVDTEFVPLAELDLSENPDASKYGDLRRGKNPNGSLTDNANGQRGQLITPAYEGGDRFFPDADIDDVDTGKNIVRVRATVANGDIGDIVVFKPFDVDDPSDEPYPLPRYKQSIDRNGDAGGDNRGRVAEGNLYQAAPSVAVGRDVGGAHGRLRAVNAGEELPGWGADGAKVEAKVKQLIVGGVGQVDGTGNPILIAEVDLLTTFAPGDNFRVLALPKREEGLMDSVHVTAEQDAFRVPTNSDKVGITPQLTVWRHLYVEDDATAEVFGLVDTGVTRQTNRYADAFIEPDYDTLAAINTGAPAVGGRALRVSRAGIVHADDVAAVNAQRQSADLESNQFWVSYVTDAFAAPEKKRLGYTSNALTAGAEFQLGFIFTAEIAALPQVADAAIPADAAAIVAQKVALHEIGHQFLKPGGSGTDDDGHRGQAIHIATYLGSPDAAKSNPTWLNVLNVMNFDASAVPMDNPATGPIDWFFFHPLDIDKMRRLGKL